MLPLGAPKVHVPGSLRHDLFPKPDLNGNETVDEPTDPLTQHGFTSNQVALNPTDLLLANSLNVFDKIEVDRQEPQPILRATTPVAQSLLKMIQLYPAQYTGQISPQSTYGCNLVAGKLGDLYNLDTKRFQRYKFLENDYLGTIAREEEAGRMLVAFDRTFALAALVQYNGYDVIRSQKLREQVQELNPVMNEAGTVYLRWESEPDLPKEQPVPLSSIKIYSFYDSGITTDKGDLTELYMIFAPVGPDEAERILIYLNLNIQLYSYRSFMAVESLPLDLGLDFRHLFPVDLTFIGNFTLIFSELFDSDVLEYIYKYQEVPFVYNRVDDLQGAFATWLLAEALFFEFPLRWAPGRFVVGMAGHIQARDINEQFARILTELGQIRLTFTPVPDFQAAASLARTTDLKCFYHNGTYYAVGSKENEAKPESDEVVPDLATVSSIELVHPLRAAVDPRTAGPARQYLALLGYRTEPNPSPYRNEIDLGYRTYQKDDRIFTIYYYTSTHDADVEVHEIDGPHDEEARIGLERLLREGYFSTQRFRNITRGYPGFVPSDSAIPRNLPRNLQALLNSFDG